MTMMLTDADQFAVAQISVRNHLARRWWAIALRGSLAMGFGVICLAQPALAGLSLVMLFAAYAIADGIATLIASISALRGHDRWRLIAFEALVSIGAGLAALAIPGVTLLVLVLLIGTRAYIGGVVLLMSAAKLDNGRGWMALAGLSSIVLGVALFAAPMIGALVLTWWTGTYALVFGAILLTLARRLRKAACAD